HVFVARPPLYKVTQKKHVRFVQTAEETNRELMQRGRDGTKLNVPPAADGTASVFEGERLARLVEVLGQMEESLQILERRGLSLPAFLPRAGANGLPVYRVHL